jgi:DNA polymerase-1
MKRPRIFLIDGSSYIYRAFHAIPYLSVKEGIPTNAVYGFTQMLLKLIKDCKPDHIAVVFDAKGPTFRHKVYGGYKAKRPEMPDTLRPQLPYIREVVRAYNIPALELEGYEADDIIGTLVRRFKRKELEIVIVTCDKDMMQLVDANTTILDTMKDMSYGVAEVKEKFGGLEPQKIIEIMALAGDSCDNIPGVPGVGEKTAIKLIKEFETVDCLYSDIERVTGKVLREKLIENEESARLSRGLATIDTDVPIDCSFEDLSLSRPNYSKLRELFKELELKRFLRDIQDEISDEERFTVSPCRVIDREGLDKLSKELFKNRIMAISLKTAGQLLDYELIALAISTGFESSTDHSSVFLLSPIDTELDESSIIEALKPIIEDEGVVKLSNDAKGLYTFFKGRGIKVHGIGMDTTVASYLLNPSASDHSLKTVADNYLGIEMRGPEKTSMESVKRDQLCRIVSEEAEAIRMVSPKLTAELEGVGLLSLFREIEMPLIKVLVDMELAGIKIDEEYLHGLSSELETKLSLIASDIYVLAGYEFNINSPKQLAEILFKDLNLKPVRKTKTGFSTNEDVLIALSTKHELPGKVLEYRQLAKLKSTYVDSLIELINPATGRVHTSFNQTVTATGRLSSSRPNLQNIPIRTEIGKRIRGAFIAEDDWVLLSADYSQIELRLVAHLSGDEILIDAFNRGEDIHQRTASEVFGIASELVTKEVRRRAKAINFGIIYGMGSYGLANELGISQEEAKKYIDSYFDRYRGVRRFIDSTIKEATERGYTTTLFGRKRYIKELTSDVETIKRFGERIAINTPIQGSAADIIKIAMINLAKRLERCGYRSRMLLQIHDELLFEVPKKEVESIKEITGHEMEGVINLSVPIKVNIATGRSWLEAGLE